jgi:hypothetical protein
LRSIEVPKSSSYFFPLAFHQLTRSQKGTRIGRSENPGAENEGFNAQKNSDLNMEHPYSHTNWAAYYYLLQIAHIILQLFENGGLLLNLAKEQGKRSAVHLFGSLKNMARRLLESLRYVCWPDDAFDGDLARKIQIRLNDTT